MRKFDSSFTVNTGPIVFCRTLNNIRVLPRACALSTRPAAFFSAERISHYVYYHYYYYIISCVCVGNCEHAGTKPIVFVNPLRTFYGI